MQRHIFAVFATTLFAFSANAFGQSAGPVFQPTFTVVHSFQGPPDGANPAANVIFDEAGNMYGTTIQGGVRAGICSGGCGTVFKIDTQGNETVLYSFNGNTADGNWPYGGLLRDPEGNFYGTTYVGGTSYPACNSQGCGTVFTLRVTGEEQVVYNFTGLADGWGPYASLTLGTDGRVYSTTHLGGLYDNWGTVFAVDKHGVETVIHDFNGYDNDGGSPWGGLVRDSAGNMYGMTFAGDNFYCEPGFQLGCGVVYKVTETGDETVLYPFTGQADGNWGAGSLAIDGAGNLYGANQAGSAQWGTVFKVDPRGNLTVLHSFSGGVGGANAWGGVIRDAAGNLYGTTLDGGGTGCPGGLGCGTVWLLQPSGKFTILHSFTGGPDGWGPSGTLALDSAGNLYGTAANGGAYDDGVIFKISR